MDKKYSRLQYAYFVTDMMHNYFKKQQKPDPNLGPILIAKHSLPVSETLQIGDLSFFAGLFPKLVEVNFEKLPLVCQAIKEAREVERNPRPGGISIIPFLVFLKEDYHIDIFDLAYEDQFNIPDIKGL